MINSKLVQYIAGLDARGQDRFRLFVNSPYFNQHQKTVELLDYVLAGIDKSPTHLDRRRVYEVLFPGEAYHEQTLYNLMSSLKKLYHRFLAQEHLEGLKFEEEINLIQSAFHRQQFGLMKNRAKQLEKQLKVHPYADARYYYANYRYLRTMGYYAGHYEDRSKAETFQRMLDNLDRFYFLEKLKNACHLTANMILLNTQYDFSFLDALLNYYRKHANQFTDDASIELYYTVLMSLRDNANPQYYQKLKRMIQERVDHFHPDEQHDLYAFANNYCVRRINNGDESYQLELFQLYKYGLSSEIIYENGLLSEWNYKNITVLGCLLGEYDWTEQFLEDYKELLPPGRQENAYNYNMAHLHYTKQRYQEALSHLLRVQFSDVKYHLNHNSLLLATYYALGDEEGVLSLIETFRIYVIRNRKMTNEQKRSYTNFLRFAKKITQLKYQPALYAKVSKAEKFAKLLDKVRQTDLIVNRYWLEKACRAEAGDFLAEQVTELAREQQQQV